MGAVARKAAGAVGARMAATAERFWEGGGGGANSWAALRAHRKRKSCARSRM